MATATLAQEVENTERIEVEIARLLQQTSQSPSGAQSINTSTAANIHDPVSGLLDLVLPTPGAASPGSPLTSCSNADYTNHPYSDVIQMSETMFDPTMWGAEPQTITGPYVPIIPAPIYTLVTANDMAATTNALGSPFDNSSSLLAEQAHGGTLAYRPKETAPISPAFPAPAFVSVSANTPHLAGPPNASERPSSTRSSNRVLKNRKTRGRPSKRSLRPTGSRSGFTFAAPATPNNMHDGLRAKGLRTSRYKMLKTAGRAGFRNRPAQFEESVPSVGFDTPTPAEHGVAMELVEPVAPAPAPATERSEGFDTLTLDEWATAILEPGWENDEFRFVNKE
ncbi:MAG: hypothetical protein Q9209_006537 [Squamulea sp. 1 TL-2023]